MRVALIGTGSIATALRRSFTSQGIDLVAALCRSAPDPAWAEIAVHDVDALAEARPSLVVECAGHEAVAAYVPRLLERGLDVVLVSVGALADPALETRILSQTTRGRVILPAGALAGIDALAAAARDGLTRVELTSTKPPAGWGLDATTRTVLFDGSAREAAQRYPKNANVAATAALAGFGFDKTRVRLVADPAAQGNTHRLDVEGMFGRFTSEIAGNPLPDNPRTSRLTAASILRAIHLQTSRVLL